MDLELVQQQVSDDEQEIGRSLSRKEGLELYNIIMRCQHATYECAEYGREGEIRGDGQDKYHAPRLECFNAIMKLFHAEIENETQS